MWFLHRVTHLKVWGALWYVLMVDTNKFMNYVMKDVLNFDKVADICTWVDRQWLVNCMLFLLDSERDRRGTLSSSPAGCTI